MGWLWRRYRHFRLWRHCSVVSATCALARSAARTGKHHLEHNVVLWVEKLQVSESKATIREIATSKKQKVCVLVDEAQLLRRDVLAELRTLLNFDHDGSNFLSLVLSGQPTLLAHLQYRQAAPLASRVMSKAQIKPLSQMEMEEYLSHHLRVAGSKKMLFDQPAITAIHQGSAGGLRRANQLASGGLMAAAIDKCDLVTAEHIRAATSELI